MCHCCQAVFLNGRNFAWFVSQVFNCDGWQVRAVSMVLGMIYNDTATPLSCIGATGAIYVHSISRLIWRNRRYVPCMQPRKCHGEVISVDLLIRWSLMPNFPAVRWRGRR